MSTSKLPYKIVFFGTSPFSVHVLDTFITRGLLPDLIVTAPDRPQGRKLVMHAPPAKIWAEAHAVPVLQFDKLNAEAVIKISSTISASDLFIVASYGLIIPQAVLDIPKYGTLNIHPSLLPLYRGASPLQSMILADDHDLGVTIMQMDAKMDHGPIVAQSRLSEMSPSWPELGTSVEWPPRFDTLEQVTAEVGAKMLADSLDTYIKAVDAGTVTEKFPAQDHTKATFTQKISKEDGLIDIHKALADSAEGYKALLKIQAFHGWPNAYFFLDKTHTNAAGVTESRKIRIVVKEAHWNADENKLVITRITPEGGKEMNYDDFIRGSHIQI